MRKEYISPPGDESVLIYDVECATVDGKPNAEKDILKLFGYYSYKIGKCGIIPYTDKEAIQKVINAHKFLVGFNNEKYDNPIIERFGVSLEYKRIIDMRKIFKQRAGSMVTKKGLLGKKLMKFSLDYITRFLDLVDDETAKDKIDYKIFKKDTWTKEDVAKMKFYTERDIEITKKLYEWLEDYFSGLKDFIPEKDVAGKYHLSDTVAKFVYKAICHALGWEPIYDSEEFQRMRGIKSISGGYVSFPAGEKFEGPIYCLDFNSLYPHIMMQCDLYGRVQDGQYGWSGGGKWDVKGTYNDKELHIVGQLLKSWYFLRLFYKRKIILGDGKIISMKDASQYKGQIYNRVVKNKTGQIELHLETIDDTTIEECDKLYKEGVDPREYTIKIILNTIYGILNNAYYKLVYDLIAGGDCTRIARQWVKYARKVFREAGYTVVYSDTDSYYILDHIGNKDKIMEINRKIIQDIKNSVPFPQLTFDSGVDAEIKYMFFFKGKIEEKDSDIEMDEDDYINKPKGFMKKNYVYVTTDNQIVVKNLGIEKKNISPLAKKIFWEKMGPYIIKEGKIKFYKTEIQNWVRELLEKDISLIYMRKSVNSLNTYVKNPNDIHAQISKKYGPGIHFLVPNNRKFGVGKGVKYCSVEEFEKLKMGIADIDFTNFWREINYFVKEKKHLKLFDYY